MPGAGTHATIIQHLAQANPAFKAALGDPTLNADWATYGMDEALRSRYAVLGAMGPDIFYAMLDYGGDIQKFEDVLIKVTGTFQCVGKLNGEINRYIDKTANSITNDAWDSIQSTFNYLGGILKDGILDLLIDKNNFWSLFLPLRQVDDYRQNWYWADFLHYVKTGCFTQKLLDTCQKYSTDPRTTSFLKAYSLGYLTHYVADTVGHAWVNRIVESPWRNCWQRHHLVENFIDAYVWDHWHDPSTIPQRPADEDPLDVIRDQATAHDPSRMIGDGAPLHYSRLNDLCNIGSTGIDGTIDSAISSVCESIQKGLFDIGVTSVPTLQAPDDPAFITWTNFMADAMWETYPPTLLPSGLQDHPTKLSTGSLFPCPDPGGYPSAEDVAGAYGVYRLVLSLATEDKVDAPKPPDIVGDLSTILNQLWKQVQQNLGGIQPPPSIPTSGNFSLDALWDAIKRYAHWLGQVAAAVLKTIGDIIVAAFNAGVAVVTDTIKAGLYLLNSALFALYHSVRMTLVMSAYSVPLTQDLTGGWGPLDLQTLWKTTGVAGSQPYPIEPVLSERDLTSDSSHPHSPYRPYFKPSTTPPVNIELPMITHPSELLAWMTPDDMLERPIGKDAMLSASGPAPPTTVPLPNPASTDLPPLAKLKTFDGSQRYFGGIFTNCEAALNAAIPNVSGTPMPAGTFLPDYNLDSDRGYAWPCWDVDYNYPKPTTPFPWNGCDPFPADTLRRTKLSALSGGIDWGTPPPPRPGLKGTDPFGNPRNGKAWVNATALGSTGVCDYAEIPFPFIVIDPTKVDPLDTLDPCSIQTNPKSPGKQLTYDYHVAPDAFLQNDPNDLVQTDPKDPTKVENDGRLVDFLRDQAKSKNPFQILANAVTLSLNKTFFDGTTYVPSPIPVDDNLVAAVSQLAVTGRDSFTKFSQLVGTAPNLGPPQDADLVEKVNKLDPSANFQPAALQDAAHSVLDTAYQTLWAIKGNDPGWRSFRSQLGWTDPSGVDNTPPHQGWIAVSGFDDTPHRPVNVPTAPYPQFDISFDVSNYHKPDGTPFHVTTRYLVASAHTFIGPNDLKKSSFTEPADASALLQPLPPPVPFYSTPAPRTVPQDTPIIPPGKIIIYIHGGGSRAEEAVGLANWLIYEGDQGGQNYTVISFDLPNSAYAKTYPVTDVVGSTYQPDLLKILIFEEQYVINFIEALDAQLGNVMDRIVAVMGGSLGGNLSVLLAGGNDKSHQYLNDLGTHPYLKTIVAWSVTAVCASTFAGIISNGDAGAYIAGLKDGATDKEMSGRPPEDHTVETQYLYNVYFKALSPGYVGIVPYIPPDPIMWFRGEPHWQDCKKASITQSRFDRYEIYSEYARHWTNAIDLEQIYFSFQDDCRYRTIASSPASHLLLASGDGDNFDPNAIYNSTIDVARLIRHSAHGKAEFWSDTGHSFHSERPRLFAQEIVYFLNHLDASDSANGTATSPQPAPYSRTDQ